MPCSSCRTVLATTTKCLAQCNKSDTRAKATKEQRSLPAARPPRQAAGMMLVVRLARQSKCLAHLSKCFAQTNKPGTRAKATNKRKSDTSSRGAIACAANGKTRYGSALLVDYHERSQISPWLDARRLTLEKDMRERLLVSASAHGF